MSSLMPRVWGLLNYSWKGSQHANGEKVLWTGHVVRISTLSEKPGNSSRIPSAQIQAASTCARCARCNIHDMSSAAWESGQRPRKFVPPSVRQWEPGGDPWKDNCYKPTSVYAQLGTPNALVDCRATAASPWSLSLDHADQPIVPGSEKWLSPKSVTKLCQQGQVKGAIAVLEVLIGMNSGVDRYLFYSVLKECVVKKDLILGSQVHSLAVKMGLGSDTFLCNHLIRMYAGHGKLQEAMDVFRGVALPDSFMCSSIISAYAKQGQAERAIDLYRDMRLTGMKPDNFVFVAALQACAAVGDLQSGKQVHDDVLAGGLERDMLIGTCLIKMYVKCCKLKDARRVFDELEKKDVVTWTVMISGYARVEGMGQNALSLYSAMQNEGMTIPDAVTFVCLLQACASVGVSALEKGKQLHSQIKEQGVESDIAVGGSLVNMYAKCGSLTEASTVFDQLCKKNVMAWNAMIAGYAKVEGMGQNAFSLYNAMQNEGTIPDSVTFVCLLQACANVGVSALETGKQLHLQLKDRQLESCVVVGCSLVNMYAKCGSLRDARIVFDSLGEKNCMTWTAMIGAYAKVEGMGQDGLLLYSDMLKEGMVIPDAVTFVCLLQACANVGLSALEKGKQIHLDIDERGFASDMVVGGSLVNMYSKCGSLRDARIVFDRLVEKNVVTWNAMLAGYAKVEGMGQEALTLYSTMLDQGVVIPDALTFVCLLQACANVGASALEKGKQLHSELKGRELEYDMDVGGSLVNMYAKCGSLPDARAVFDALSEKNVVTWNAMICGYAQQECTGHEALSLYSAMQHESNAVPDEVTFLCLLRACANVGMPALENGKQLHSLIKERGFESDRDLGSSLVNMYAKCGSLTDARSVFDGLIEKNVVTWTAMIAGYVQQEGMSQEALSLYNTMLNEGIVTPNAVTFVCLLQACASVGALQQGKQLHLEICKGGFESDILVGPCLVKMYAQCGRLEDSREVFDRLPTKSLETWSALLQGYAKLGEGIMAIECFEELLKQGLQPDGVTYICLLTACSHAGLVDEGQRYFETMEEVHGVKPNEWHYTCMVDLLGRSGHLDRAEQMLYASDLAGSAVSWTALLSACKSYGYACLGRRCFGHLVNLQPTLATAYVLLGCLHANTGEWDEVERVESLRKAVGARKKAAKACIEVKREVHHFTVGEERSDFAATLRNLNSRLKKGGHVPLTQLVLRAGSEQDKEDELCGHAEKLALAYGLLHTAAGSTLVVTKNLRMCNDCHSSTKIMSRVEKREIVVRDGHKVHRFHNGACSCQDRP